MYSFSVVTTRHANKPRSVALTWGEPQAQDRATEATLANR